MIYCKRGIGTAACVVTYAFLAPTRLTIRRPDGRVEQVGYGIGEQIGVIEPDLQSLVAVYDKRAEIPLADGSAIIAYPDDMRYERVWPA